MMWMYRGWCRFGPVLVRKVSPLHRNAPPRHMTSGLPLSGTNITLTLLCGGSVVTALVYAYKTLHSDSLIYHHRVSHTHTAQEAEAASEALESVAETTVGKAGDAFETVVAVPEAAADPMVAMVMKATAEEVEAVVAKETKTTLPVAEEGATETAVSVDEPPVAPV